MTLAVYLAKLVLWTLAGMAPAIALAGFFFGESEALRGSIALAICLGLAVGSLWLAIWSLPRGPVWQMGAILGGSGARSAIAISTAVALYFVVPVCSTVSFLIWMAIAYLLTLAIEVVLLLRALRRASEKTVSD